MHNTFLYTHKTNGKQTDTRHTERPTEAITVISRPPRVCILCKQTQQKGKHDSRTHVHTHARLPRVVVHCPHRSHPSHGPSHALQAVGEGNCNYMCGAAGTVDCRVWAVVRTGSLTATGGRCP